MRFATWIMASVIAVSALGAGTAEARPVAKKAVNAAVKKAVKHKHPAKLASWKAFSSWPKKKQDSYMAHLRRMDLAWARHAFPKMKFAENRQNVLDLFNPLPEAYALTNLSCMLGGVQRPLKTASDGSLRCPTKGRECNNGQADTYECGGIWSHVCVSRLPLEIGNTIDDRCMAKWNELPADKKNITKEDYNSLKVRFESVINDCDDPEATHEAYKARCEKFKERVAFLRGLYPDTPADNTGGGEDTTGEAEGGTDGDDLGTGGTGDNGGGTGDNGGGTGDNGGGTGDNGGGTGDNGGGTGDNGGGTTTQAVDEKQHCIDVRKPKYGVLACLQCGMEATQPYAEELKPGSISKWMNLLGAMAQTYYGPFTDQKKLQETVMSMLSTYGYCLDSEFDLPNYDVSFAKKLVNGEVTLTGNQKGTGNNEVKFAKMFDLYTHKPGRGANKNLSANNDMPMLYAYEIFREAKKDFNPKDLEQRQWRFQSIIHAFHKDNPKNDKVKTPMGNCLRAVEERLNKVKYFGLCPINGLENRNCKPFCPVVNGVQTNIDNDTGARWYCEMKPKPSNRSYCTNGFAQGKLLGTDANGNLIQTTKIGPGEISRNEKMYNNMAGYCDVPDSPKIPQQTCIKPCYESKAFDGGGLPVPNCQKPDDPEDPHDPPKDCGKEECETPHDTPTLEEPEIQHTGGVNEEGEGGNHNTEF